MTSSNSTSLQILEHRYLAKQRLLRALQAIQDCRKQIPTLLAPIYAPARRNDVLKHFQSAIKSHTLDNTIVRFLDTGLVKVYTLIEIHTTFQGQNETVKLWLDEPRDHPDIRSSERKTDKQIILALATLGRRIQNLKSEQGHDEKRRRSVLRKQFARSE